MTTDNIVKWATQLSIVAWVFSKTQILLETLRTSNQPRKEFLCIIGSRTFVPISARNKRQYPTIKQNLKSFRMDAGLRMDGLTALQSVPTQSSSS